MSNTKQQTDGAAPVQAAVRAVIIGPTSRAIIAGPTQPEILVMERGESFAYLASIDGQHEAKYTLRDRVWTHENDLQGDLEGWLASQLGSEKAAWDAIDARLDAGMRARLEAPAKRVRDCAPAGAFGPEIGGAK